jgi:hypothetical protein
VTDTQPAPQPPDIRRRTLTPFGYAVCVAVPILIAVVGLTILHFNYDQEDLVKGQRVPILTSDWTPGQGGDDALLSGEVTLDDDRCVLVGDQVVVWPQDFEATVQRVGRTDQVRVYDPDRDIVARSGETIEVGGGFGDVGEYAGRPCAPDSGDVFFVQSEVAVVRGP